MSRVPTRQDIPVEQTWDDKSVFESFDAWQAEYQAVSDQLDEIDAYKGTLSQSPQRLKEWLETYSTIARRAWKIYMYPSLWIECDNTNEKIKGMAGQARGLMGQLFAKVSFTNPELLAMDGHTLNKWLQEDELKLYQKLIDDILRLKDHVLSAEVEQVLGMLSDPLSRVESIRGALVNMDMKFEPAVSSTGETYELVQSTSNQLLSNPDREVRKTAWNNFADSFLAYNNTLANAYLASVNKNVTVAAFRGIKVVFLAT